MRRLSKYIGATALFLMCIACGESKKEDKAQVQEEEIILQGKELAYRADTTKMQGYLVYDKSTSDTRPGVLVIHEWWGHNEYTRKRADMLAEAGYVAMAIDMYGNGKQAEHPEDAGKFAGMVMGSLPVAEARFDAALEQLRNHPAVNPEQIAAIGYCFGGSVALTMANLGKDLDAVAAFHSGIALPVMPSDSLQARILVANGEKDPMVTDEQVQAFKRALDSVGADYEYISYPGATHAYTSKAADSLGKKFDLPLAYNAEADERSWKRLMEFLQETFTTEPQHKNE